MDYKRARLTSDGTLLAKKTEAELEKYNFMKWMEPFIRFRTTKMMNEKPATMENKSPSQICHRSSRDTEKPTVSKAIADYAYQQTVGGRKRSYDYAHAPPPHRVYYEEQSSRVSYAKPVSMAAGDINGCRSYTPNNALSLDRLLPEAAIKRSRVLSQSLDDSYNRDTSHAQQDMQQLQQRYYNDKDTQHQPQQQPPQHPQQPPQHPQQPPQHPQQQKQQQQQQQQQQQTAYSDHQSSSPTPTEMSYKSAEEQHNNLLSNNNNNNNNKFNTKLLSNEDEIFSAFIISELKNLDEKRRYKVKHKITNVLFDALMEQCDNTENTTTVDGGHNVVAENN